MKLIPYTKLFYSFSSFNGSLLMFLWLKSQIDPILSHFSFSLCLKCLSFVSFVTSYVFLPDLCFLLYTNITLPTILPFYHIAVSFRPFSSFSNLNQTKHSNTYFVWILEPHREIFPMFIHNQFRDMSA